MAHTERELSQLIARVRRIKGQLEAIERKLAEHHRCGEILQQIAASRGAINSLMAQVLEGHIREHLIDPTRQPTKTEDQALQELAQIMKSYLT
jgi:DNA-binding FrmR family transcriptional regulator